METAPLENGFEDVVKAVYWRITADDGKNTTQMESKLLLDDANPMNFTPYANLTESQVTSWLESSLNLNQIKEDLSKKLETLSNPKTVLKKSPWVTEKIAVLEE